MKINSITTPNRFHSRELIPSAKERREHATLSNNINNNQINTTINQNSDGRVNFKGAAPLPLLHKIAAFSLDKSLIAEAIFALFITCGLRPITIMATAKNDDDKAKCEYQAVKSISSGLVGLGTTAFVGTPIHKATKLVAENKKFEKAGVEVLTKLAEETQDTEFSSRIKSVIKDGKLDGQAVKAHGAYILRKVKSEAKDSYDSVFEAFSYKRVLDGKVDIIKTPGKYQEEIEVSIKKGIDSLKEVLDGFKAPDAKMPDYVDNIKKLLLDGNFNENEVQKLAKNKKALKDLKLNISKIAGKEKAEAIEQGIKAKFKDLNYFSTAKNVVDKLYQPVFMPIRAAITIALVPIILKALGKQKPSSGKPKDQAKPVEAAKIEQKPQTQTPVVAPVVTNTPKAAKPQNVFSEIDKSNNAQQNPTFKGITDFAVKPLTKLSGEVANSDFFKKWISKFSASPRAFTHLMVLDSVILSTFYTINSLRNKKIEKEQKPQMVINDALTLAVSAAGSYLMEDAVGKKVNEMGEKYIKSHRDTYETLGKEALEKLGDKSPVKILLDKVDGLVGKTGVGLDDGVKEVVENFKLNMSSIVETEKTDKAFMIVKEELENYAKDFGEYVKKYVADVNNSENRGQLVTFLKNQAENVQAREKAKDFLSGLNKLKVLVVFGLIYRYLGPVLITPLANKLSDKFFGKDKKDKKAEATTAKAPAQPAQVAQQQAVQQASQSQNLLQKHLKSTTA